MLLALWIVAVLAAGHESAFVNSCPTAGNCTLDDSSTFLQVSSETKFRRSGPGACESEVAAMKQALIQQLGSDQSSLVSHILDNPAQWKDINIHDDFVSLCTPERDGFSSGRRVATLWSGYSTGSALQMQQLEGHTICVKVPSKEPGEDERWYFVRAPTDLPLMPVIMPGGHPYPGSGTTAPLDGCRGDDWPIARRFWQSMSRAYVLGFASWLPRKIWILIAKPVETDQDRSYLKASILFQDELDSLETLLTTIPYWKPEITVRYDPPRLRHAGLDSTTPSATLRNSFNELVTMIREAFPEVSARLVSGGVYTEIPPVTGGCETDRGRHNG